MIKKLSLIGLCGISLMGMTGCGVSTQTEAPVEDVAVDSVATKEESDKVHYLSYHGWGITPKTLFDAMNEVNPNLKLDESLFEVWIDEETGEKTYFGSPVEKVVIDYRLVQTDANYNIEDENLVGMLLDGLYIHYDKTDETATKYATDLLNTFQTVLVQGHLPEAFKTNEMMLDQYLSKVEIHVETFEAGTLRGYPIEETWEPYVNYLADFEQIAAISIR